MKTMKNIITDHGEGRYWETTACEMKKVEDCMHVVNVYPDVTYQTMRGFGGAFTEAAAHNYAMMSDDKKTAVINDYFGKEGLAYHFGRLHMNSCDFALGNYTYIEEGDVSLDSFDISHDKKEIIPMVKDAQKTSDEKLEFLLSTWSPPAFMKSNKDMNHGGSLETEYYPVWANYFVKFIEEYKKEGIDVGYLTIQNEPLAKQTWDSCIYTSEEEGDFAGNYLGPALKKAGLSDIGIFIWDHNKEEAYRRVKDTLKVENAEKYVNGVAMHWYTGDHFEAIEIIRKMYPQLEVFFTEGCVEYSRFADSGEVQKAEMYAHDILGNLNAGITASIDWNLILDEKGGPNHVGNFCAAPIMFNTASGTYEKRLTYYYIGHFSRYIKPGAVRIGTTRYTDKIEATAFLNPDGERVLVLLNKTEEKVPVTIREENCGMETELAPHSICTICY